MLINNIQLNNDIFNNISFGSYKNYKNSDDYEIIFSVSNNKTTLLEFKNKKFFWFPLSEYKNIGIESIYGLCTIFINHIVHDIYINYNNRKNIPFEIPKIFIYCDAGINRSKFIYECFYYLLFNKKINHEYIKVSFEELLIFNEFNFLDFEGKQKFHKNIEENLNKNSIDNNISLGLISEKFYEFLDNFLSSNNLETLKILL